MESASTCDCATKLLNGKVFSTLLYAETGIDGWLGLSQRESAGFAGCSAERVFVSSRRRSARFHLLPMPASARQVVQLQVSNLMGPPLQPPGPRVPGGCFLPGGTSELQVGRMSAKDHKKHLVLDLLHRAGQLSEEQFARYIGSSKMTSRQYVVLAAIAQNEGQKSDGDRQRDWYGSLECCGDGCAPCEGRLASTPTQKG